MTSAWGVDDARPDSAYLAAICRPLDRSFDCAAGPELTTASRNPLFAKASGKISSMPTSVGQEDVYMPLVGCNAKPHNTIATNIVAVHVALGRVWGKRCAGIAQVHYLNRLHFNMITC